MSQPDYTAQDNSVNAKNNSTFKKRPCHWYKKNQSIPNAVFYNANLSDSAVRLLGALNALPDSWIIIQSDIRERLGWGRDKMRNAIKECEVAGYMRVERCRGEDGTFSISNYEYDVEPVYLEESLPRTENPRTEVSRTENHPLPCSLGIVPCSKEQQQEEGSVVVSSASPSEEEKEAARKVHEIFEQYEVPDSTRGYITRNFPDILRVLEVLAYAHSSEASFDVPMAWATRALQDGWEIPKGLTSKVFRVNRSYFYDCKEKNPDLMKHWDVYEDVAYHKFQNDRKVPLTLTPEEFRRALNSELANGV